MGRLTEKRYWESIYKSEPTIKSLYSKRKFRLFIKSVIGPKAVEFTRDHDEQILWEKLLKYLPRDSTLKALEVGSAPGLFLVKLNQVFGYRVYGLEYTPSGALLNRKVFEDNGLGAGNVIEEDFFSKQFHQTYGESFDIVISRGFIEHFSNPEKVINQHLNLLKKGGYLVISIPNLRGINYLLTLFFNKRQLSMHNLEIMKKANFVQLFQTGLETLYCDYYGFFTFNLFNVEKSKIKRILLLIFKYLQKLLNIIFKLIFRKARVQNAFTSPFLLFIGIKK